MSQDHDLRYKKFFSNPRLLKELLESFVPEAWVSQVDYTRAETVETSFITDDFKQKESDLIWKLPLGDKTLYLYILMEFQSTVDKFMALRVLRYLCEFYQSLESQKLLTTEGKLPVVFPLVLYDGDGRWTAPEALEDLIDTRISSEYLPRFRYFKLAENEVSPLVLDKLDNLVSVLFSVETLDPEVLTAKAGELIAKLKNEHPDDIRLFQRWLEHYFGTIGSPLDTVLEPLVEVRTMLATKLRQKEQEWTSKGRQEGRLEGRQEGRQEGIHEGQIEVARKMKNLGLDLSLIVAATGLTEEEVNKL